MAPGTSMIVELLGGVALLLWGVRMVRTAVMRGWGERLGSFIEQRLSSRMTAFGGGVAATALLGSSTAMALIVAGLAGNGAIGGPTGLAVLLGADVGSALVSGIFASGSSDSKEMMSGWITSARLEVLMNSTKSCRPRS